MSPEQASERFHDSYAGYFDLNAGERVVGAWSGPEFQGAKSAAGHLAGAALNRLAAGTVGVSTYVPNVYVGLTSQGRVLVSREYSELGDRGHFKQIGDFAPVLAPSGRAPRARERASVSRRRTRTTRRSACAHRTERRTKRG